MDERLSLEDIDRDVAIEMSRDDWFHVHRLIGRIPIHRFSQRVAVERAWKRLSAALKAAPSATTRMKIIGPLGELLALGTAATQGALRRAHPLEWAAAHHLAVLLDDELAGREAK